MYIVSKSGIKKNLKKYGFFCISMATTLIRLLGVGSEKLNLGNKVSNYVVKLPKSRLH